MMCERGGEAQIYTSISHEHRKGTMNRNQEMNRVCLISEDKENQQPAMIMGHRMNNDK